MQHVADNGHCQLLEAVIGRALVAADREQVEQTLRRMRVAAIAGIEDRHTRCSMFGEKVRRTGGRSEEHTSELQSLMRTPYAVFCLKKTNIPPPIDTSNLSPL